MNIQRPTGPACLAITSLVRGCVYSRNDLGRDVTYFIFSGDGVTNLDSGNYTRLLDCATSGWYPVSCKLVVER